MPELGLGLFTLEWTHSSCFYRRDDGLVADTVLVLLQQLTCLAEPEITLWLFISDKVFRQSRCDQVTVVSLLHLQVAARLDGPKLSILMKSHEHATPIDQPAEVLRSDVCEKLGCNLAVGLTIEIDIRLHRGLGQRILRPDTVVDDGILALDERVCILRRVLAVRCCSQVNDSPTIVRHVIQQRVVTIDHFCQRQRPLVYDELTVLHVNRASAIAVPLCESAD